MRYLVFFHITFSVSFNLLLLFVCRALFHHLLTTSRPLIHRDSYGFASLRHCRKLVYLYFSYAHHGLGQRAASVDHKARACDIARLAPRVGGGDTLADSHSRTRYKGRFSAELTHADDPPVITQSCRLMNSNLLAYT
jgi:hypothetical protein